MEQKHFLGSCHCQYQHGISIPMAMVNQHGNGISNWKWSCHCHLVLSECLLQKASSWTYYSFYSRLLCFRHPFFSLSTKNSDSSNSLWTLESRNANCTPCCVTISKSLWIVPLVPLATAADGVARTGVGTVGFPVPEDVSLDWRRTGVRGRGAKAMGDAWRHIKAGWLKIWESKVKLL